MGEDDDAFIQNYADEVLKDSIVITIENYELYYYHLPNKNHRNTSFITLQMTLKSIRFFLC